MELTSQEIIGMIALFGIAMLAILMMLKRFGVIKFGNSAYCPDHTTFRSEFKEVRDEHLVRGQTIETHEKRLDEGKVMFTEIKTDVADIKGNIKLLLDRSQQRRATDK